MIAQEAPAKPAWSELVVRDEEWSFKLVSHQSSTSPSKLVDSDGKTLALVSTVDHRDKGTIKWNIMDTAGVTRFTVTAGNTSGTFFIMDVSWGGVVGTIQKKFQNSDSEIEVYADDKVENQDALLLTCLGKTHNLYILNGYGETVARAKKGTRFVNVAMGVDSIFVVCLYLVREKLDHISETFH